MEGKPNTYIGSAPPRREDPLLLTGQAHFGDDIALTDPLHIAFLRSPVAYGAITDLDTEDAAEAPGVQAIHRAADLPRTEALSVNAIIPITRPLPYPILAEDRVTCIGQPVAAVLAETRLQAADACDLIVLDVAEDPLPAPTEIAAQSWTRGDPEATFARAAHIVTAEVHHPRLAPAPMEPRTIAIAYDTATDQATIYHATQTPHRTRSEAARILGLAPERLRVISTWVGGAFGMKASLYPEEVFAIWAAFHHRRDVKWIASRSEDLLSATHGRGLTTQGRLALDTEGRFLALEAEVTAPLGPWLPNSALIPAFNAARILPGGYRIDTLSLRTRAQSHALPPTGIYRGAGRPEACMLMERLVEEASLALACDPLALRLQNLRPASALPHTTVSGHTLCSGDYPALLRRLAESADYDALRLRRSAIRAAGGLAGLGLAFYLEPSGEGWETATVTLHANGTAHIASGSSSQGHGRETAFAQIAADALNLSMDDISVAAGDTATCPEGIGAVASRSTAIGGSAVLEACQDARAQQAKGARHPITADVRYTNTGQAWSAGAYACLVEIDRDTGAPVVRAAHAIDDAGRIINPTLVAGQILGGFAQGFGEAFMEGLHLDADGQLLSGSFMDYAMPRATDVPPLALEKVETPSPMNSLGAKGIGEAGCIGAPAALLNAVLDALRPEGVRDLSMPMTSAKIWTALQAAHEGQSP